MKKYLAFSSLPLFLSLAAGAIILPHQHALAQTSPKVIQSQPTNPQPLKPEPSAKELAAMKRIREGMVRMKSRLQQMHEFILDSIKNNNERTLLADTMRGQYQKMKLGMVSGTAQAKPPDGVASDAAAVKPPGGATAAGGGTPEQVRTWRGIAMTMGNLNKEGSRINKDIVQQAQGLKQEMDSIANDISHIKGSAAISSQDRRRIANDLNNVGNAIGPIKAQIDDLRSQLSRKPVIGQYEPIKVLRSCPELITEANMCATSECLKCCIGQNGTSASGGRWDELEQEALVIICEMTCSTAQSKCLWKLALSLIKEEEERRSRSIATMLQG
jgi:hypothetical protein